MKMQPGGMKNGTTVYVRIPILKRKTQRKVNKDTNESFPEQHHLKFELIQYNSQGLTEHLKTGNAGTSRTVIINIFKLMLYFKEVAIYSSRWNSINKVSNEVLISQLKMPFLNVY